MSGREGDALPPTSPAPPPPGAPRHARVYYSRELIAGACAAFAEDNRVYDHRGRIKAPIRALMDHVEGLIDGSAAGARSPEDAALIARLTADNDRLRAAAVCAVNGKDHGYSAVWERLISRGLLSFVGGDGSGLSRALAFIDHLAARAAGAPAAAKPASIAPAAEGEVWREDKEDLRLIRDRLAGLIHNARYEPTQESLKTVDNLVAKIAARREVAAGTPSSVAPTAAEAEAGWLRDKIAYYLDYPDTRCTFSGESCVTIKQLAKAVGLKREGT